MIPRFAWLTMGTLLIAVVERSVAAQNVCAPTSIANVSRTAPIGSSLCPPPEDDSRVVPVSTDLVQRIQPLPPRASLCLEERCVSTVPGAFGQSFTPALALDRGRLLRGRPEIGLSVRACLYPANEKTCVCSRETDTTCVFGDTVAYRRNQEARLPPHQNWLKLPEARCVVLLWDDGHVSTPFAVKHDLKEKRACQ